VHIEIHLLSSRDYDRPYISTGVRASLGDRFLGLQEFNQSDAVEAHPDVLISRNFEFWLRFGRRRGRLTDPFVPDAH
jgi:hypothetical protein